MKSVTYWYQFFTAREELVPILHDVKFTKCEIYGSTQQGYYACPYVSRVPMFGAMKIFDPILALMLCSHYYSGLLYKKQKKNVCFIWRF